VDQNEATRGGPDEPALDSRARFSAIPIDNNAVEREIRPIAIGRGNWTFIGSEHAGPWAARLYGLLGTCRLQGVNRFEWLLDELGRLRDHPRRTGCAS
jgi:hypothetical protein